MEYSQGDPLFTAKIEVHEKKIEEIHSCRETLVRDDLIRADHWQEDGKADPLFNAFQSYNKINEHDEKSYCQPNVGAKTKR